MSPQYRCWETEIGVWQGCKTYFNKGHNNFLTAFLLQQTSLGYIKAFESKPEFCKLDQINHFLKKIKNVRKCPQPVRLPLPDKGYIQPPNVTVESYLSLKFMVMEHKRFVSRKHMENSISCFQKISVHTTQIVVSMKLSPILINCACDIFIHHLNGSLVSATSAEVPGDHSKGQERCQWLVNI